MNILVINSGSSSIKYQLFTMPSSAPLCTGLLERIGSQTAAVTHKVFLIGAESVINYTAPLRNHEEGLEEVVRLLTDAKVGVIKNTNDINAVGHRVVHGGEQYTEATLVTPVVKADIQRLAELAPLHNPANYTGIEVAQKIFATAQQVVVFDTAFHQTIPPHAFRYAIPQSFYTNDKIRVYGFHGTSHQYVSEKAMEYLKNGAAKIISIHLGNGCSMAAIANGKCIDTSMGFSPLDGLIMGTRSGEIDPSVVFYLADKGFTSEQINTLLNKQSGMLGLTGFGDMRDVNKAVEEGNENAKLALAMYAYRIQKFIGAYASILNGIDAIIFTAGVGENDVMLRERVCSNLQFLGIELDSDRNESTNKNIREINVKEGRVKILVIPTNEELSIAQQTFQLLQL